MKFLVIGLGSIGVRHAKNLLAMGHEVYGLDIDESKYSIVPEWKREAVDGSIICCPTEEHASYLSGAAHGGRHIFVEKPIASRLDDKFLKLGLLIAKQLDLVVMVGNNLRFHPHVIKAKKICEQHPPSRGTFIISQYNDRPQYRRDGVMLNWLAHELDLALYLLGPAKVTAACMNGDQTIASVFLEHANGSCSTVYGDYLGKPEERMFKIACPTSKSVHMVDLVNSGYEVNRAHGKYILFDFNQTYIDEIQAFIDRINGKEDNIGATAEDGLATLKLIEDAMEMAK